MKIVFFEVRPKEEESMKDHFDGHEVSFCNDTLHAGTAYLADGADIISVFVNSEIKKDIVDKLPHLKLITTRSTGFDNIDVAYAEEKGIIVCNVPAYGSRTVAEFAFALILSLSRKIQESASRMKSGSFDMNGLCGFDLFEKTLGVIGTGKIGKNAILIGKGFGMKIVAYDLYPDTVFAAEHGIAYVELSQLLSTSDVVTIHAPYNNTTHHLVNQSNISLMKKTAIIVNTARGEIIETDAILNALKNGAIAGAGLDVFEKERIMKQKANTSVSMEDQEAMRKGRELIMLPNLIATPHVAFFSKEAEAVICDVTVSNIINFIA